MSRPDAVLWTTEKLSLPLTFGGGRITPNSLLKSATGERLCVWDEEDPGRRGQPTPQYLRVNEIWGRSRAGVVVLGSIVVDPNHLTARGDAVIARESSWDPVDAFKPVVAAAKAYGGLCLGQLTHGGPMTPDDVNRDPVSCSDTQSSPSMGLSFARARALTLPEIDDIVERFAYAADVLFKAGADGVQLHAAYGSLIAQFLAPNINKRTDEYGGVCANRVRLVDAIFRRIRQTVTDPSFILSIKLSPRELLKGGWEWFDDWATFGETCNAAEVQLVELAGSGMWGYSRDRTEPDVITPALTRMQGARNCAPVALTCGFRDEANLARAALEGHQIVGMARLLIWQPDFLNRVLAGWRFAKPISETLSATDLARTEEIPASYERLVDIGNGKEPTDFFDLEEADRLRRLLGVATE